MNANDMETRIAEVREGCESLCEPVRRNTEQHDSGSVAGYRFDGWERAPRNPLSLWGGNRCLFTSLLIPRIKHGESSAFGSNM